ncbi:MAG TPA: tetratricopeptide repeat protein [Thermoanaerobaculia bacterium]|nr:tetratricopeptide repeat protein [Thermoanaerobaculia bacterium]
MGSVRPCGLRRAALLAVLAAVLGCGGESAVRDLGTRAVLIGIDSADWTLIDPLIEAGRMPNLARLKERGAWGEIETLHDIPLSPVIWTSVATGKTADAHGISWFMVDQPDGTRVPVRSTNRKVEAIWSILARAGRRPGVVGWWATYPAEDVGRGVIVSDALGFHGFGSTARGGDDGRKTWPPSLYDQVSVLVPSEQQVSYAHLSRFVHIPEERYRQVMFTPARHVQHDPFNPIHLFQQYAVTAEGYTAIAEKLLAERRFDLFLLYYEQVDSFSHLFMKYAPPRLEWIDEESYERFKDVVTEWYVHQDELLGRVLAQIDLERTAVFVVSDHGFKSGERRIRSESTVDVQRAHLDHEPLGIFLAAGPHIPRGARVEGVSVLDVAPTLLHYLGFPVAQDMVGKVAEGAFEPAFLVRHPIRWVPTWEPDREDSLAGAEPAEIVAVDARQLAENMAALEALGYVEPGGAAVASGEGDEESSPEVHNNLGRIHLGKGEIEKARAEFETALRLDPNNAEALLNIAGIQRAEGRVAQAEQLVRRALQVDPNSAGALSQLAEIRRDQGNLDDAIRLFREAIAIQGGMPFLYLGLGDVQQRARRFEEAIASFRSALELDPDSQKAHYNLGVTYANMGRLDEAIAEYEKALAMGGDTAETASAHNNLGAIHLDRGELDQAAERFEEAVRLAPGHLESKYNLALIYQDQDRLDDAVPLLEAAARLAPDHELVNLRLGLAYVDQGRAEDAYRSLLLVRRLHPRNWVAPLYLAALHAGSGQPDPARTLLAESFEKGGDAAREMARGIPALAGLR